MKNVDARPHKLDSPLQSKFISIFYIYVNIKFHQFHVVMFT